MARSFQPALIIHHRAPSRPRRGFCSTIAATPGPLPADRRPLFYPHNKLCLRHLQAPDCQETEGTPHGRAKKKDQDAGSRRKKFLKATTIMATWCLLGTTPLGWPSSRQLPPAYAETTTITEGMSCVMSHCSNEIQQCIADSECAKGLSCFLRCAVSKNEAEGLCQERCMDLYENERLNQMTECTITENRCYPALSEDVRYPSLPRTLWDGASFSHLKRQLLQGRWYISAGLNPAFDTFDCQIHDFQSVEANDNGVIAEATFAYRVQRDDGTFFTKRGDKKLKLVDESQVARSETCKFKIGKRWGIDSFVGATNGRLSRRDATTRGSTDRALVLELEPNIMDYQDEWTILASDLNSYMVVAYRGTNAAWLGYGGLDLYTRSPIKDLNAMSATAQQDITAALAKVGLAVSDLTIVDNSCQRHL